MTYLGGIFDQSFFCCKRRNEKKGGNTLTKPVRKMVDEVKKTRNEKSNLKSVLRPHHTAAPKLPPPRGRAGAGAMTKNLSTTALPFPAFPD
jgi:hypothetical protein